MRYGKLTLAIAMLLGVGLSPRVQALSITDLFNTGVDAAGTPLSPNAVVDTHYINFSGGARPTYTTPNAGYHQYADSDYITVDQFGGGGAYTTIFYTSFTLPTNVDLNSVKIAGDYSIDDVGNDIFINGHSTGISLYNPINVTQANPFTLPTGFYQAGTNTLGFWWNNQGGPGAIDVSFTTKSYSVLTSVPEVGAFLQFGSLVALSGAGLLWRRKRSRLSVAPLAGA